jgi:hypothetical protein
MGMGTKILCYDEGSEGLSHAVLGKGFEVRTAVIYACGRPTVNHNDGVVAGSGHLVVDLGATRTGHIAMCRYSWCCLVPATNRLRDENAEECCGVSQTAPGAS